MRYLSRVTLIFITLALLAGSVQGQNSAPAADVFLADYGTGSIWRLNPDGSNAVRVITNAHGVRGVAVDGVAGKIYYQIGTDRSIRRADFDGSEVEVILNIPGVGYDLVLDVSNGKMYWTEYDGQIAVRRANLDGTNLETLPVGPVQLPVGLALESAAGALFFADYRAGTISRCNLDGSARTTVIGGRPNPNHVALDVNAGHLYWTEGVYTGRVMRSNLDGSSIVTLAPGERSPAGLALDLAAGKMYWATEDGNSIARANLDGTARETILGNLSRPLSIALNYQSLCPQPNGVTHWWSGNGNGADRVGNRHASVPAGAFGAGVANRGFAFNGSTRAAIADSPSLTITEGFTLMAWVRMDQIQSRTAFISHDEGSGTRAKWIFWYDEFGHGDTPGGPSLRLHTNSPVYGAYDVAAPWNPVPGRFYHLALTRDGSSYKLYIEGALAGGGTLEVPMPDPAAVFSLGEAEGFFLTGAIDEVKTFNRALSAAEIASVHATRSAEYCAVNTPPTIAAFGATVSAGGAGEIVTIAGVGDAEDEVASLTMTVSGVDAELTISEVTNAAGVITARVAAACGTVGERRFTLEVRDSGGSAASAPVVIDVASNATASIIPSGDQAFCAGGSVTLTANEGSSYLWSTGETSRSIVVSSAGSYSVRVTNANGCEAESTSVSVDVHANPANPSIMTTMAHGVATLTATEVPGVTYSWKRDGVAFGTGNPVTTSQSGVYSVVATTAAGCSAGSASTTVVITNGGPATTTINGVTISTDSFPPSTMLSVDRAQPSALPPAPSGYYTLVHSSGATLVAYDINATSSPTSRIQLAFDVPLALARDRKALRSFRILHGELDRNGNLVLVDRTISHVFSDNPVVRRVVASVTSLSPFALSYVLSPTVDAIEGSSAPVAVGAGTTLSATFTDPTSDDPTAGDQYTATWNWGDGSAAQAGSVVAPVAEDVGTVSGTHVYDSPGVYTVTLQLSDNTVSGGSTEVKYQYVVVYDPNGGFVSGGGWVASPPGAYRANPAVGGKATFGFVSRYRKGSVVPDGQTQFDFHVADFRFRSTGYDWLVVAGAKAQYKGVGEINGVGGYAFLLTATDGAVAGGGGVDRFRIKIWERSSDMVVYDNVLDETASDDVESAKPQAIGGGSIVIHR